MGNQHTSGKGPLEYTPSMMKGYPMQFHDIHSPNIKLSADKRTAKRVESFCKGICFGSRPVAINERVYLKFAEISTSWSGVLRFGFMAHDPTTVNPAELPRYACPDLTNKPGHWAKALPERVAVQGNVLFFYITKNGDCKFGVNNEEKGTFFSGIETNNFLYPLVDIYGNTTSMEFIDGKQIYESPPQRHSSVSMPPGSIAVTGVTPTTPPQTTHHQHHGAGLRHISSMPSTTAAMITPPSALHGAQVTPVSLPPYVLGQLPVKYYTSMNFTQFPFHNTIGRSIRLSPEKTVAVRLDEEYCNGYVFSHRPLQCGERIVIQILSVDRTFVGGIAFGMTACDPVSITTTELPDDSDMLLDRPEYWIVNKDVCVNPDIGDELSFHLTLEGQVIYGKNGHNVATLMHIDKTLPMWSFFDVYGSTQKIKCLGVTTAVGHHAAGSLHVSLPTSTQQSPGASGITPPRPPPPRTSPTSTASMKQSPRNSPHGPRRAASVNDSAITPPTLPPKQGRIHGSSPVPSALVSPQDPARDFNLPPPLIPVPINSSQSENKLENTHVKIPAPLPPPKASEAPLATPICLPADKGRGVPPAIPPRQIDKKAISKSQVTIPLPPGNQSQESMDNASNECCVCFEDPPNCVLYKCGHMCMCYKCAVDIKDNQGGECPVCRQQINDIIKIFRS